MSEPSEVCIVGAGITGLNALVVASSYLDRADTAVLVDSRARAGGMWVDTYDYVRLHQPHPIFTAGDIKWTIDQKPSHLATKPQVLDHLQRCLEVAKKRVDVEEHYGWDYVSHEDVADLVHVTFRTPDGGSRTIVTRRLVKAFGHLVCPNAALATTSDRVRSTTPELLDVSDPELRDGDAPIWIVGSGKTAMDTAHLLITELPGRKVSMLAGPGTIFARRDAFFPAGARRWWSGTPINTMARQVANRFDGTNEAEVRDWFRSTYGIAPMADAKDFLGAYLSDAELEIIQAGLDEIEMEYFTDAVDRGEGVELVMRSGRSLPVPTGTWLVGCTGSLLRGASQPYEPYVSDSGRTLSLQMRSSTTGVVSSFGGYYLTHLLFRGELGRVGLYAMDLEELARKAKPLVMYAGLSQSILNLSLISDALPARVLMSCGLDYDRWYPLPRRMLGVTQFLATHKRERDHHRRALDTLAERFDVRAGPVTAAAAATP